MTSSIETESEDLKLWEYVSASDYTIPAAPVTHKVGKGFSLVKQLFHGSHQEQAIPIKKEAELSLLPDWQLDCLAALPVWQDAVDALTLKLADWLEQEKLEFPVIFLTAAPHNGLADIVTEWAQQQNWSVIETPPPEQILAGDHAWLNQQNFLDKPWVLAELEQTYLRHPDGLNLIRRFLEQAYSGKLGRGIVACDSWAWSYIRYVWQSTLPIALTIDAFDHNRLTKVFQSLVDNSFEKPPLFRQSNNGFYVLPADIKDDSLKMSSFLQILAGYSRGNFGIAWSMWRASLRTEPDATITNEENKKNCEIESKTIWVTPWNELKQPELKPIFGVEEAIVLHTLLLHNGLSLELLQLLLPLSPNQVMAKLLLLTEAELVVQLNSVWQVSTLGYPVVRQFLLTNGYLLDQF